jgi:hypothetical protein
MSGAKVVGSMGRMSQHSDGLAFETWHIEGGDSADPAVNLIDAIIALLEKQRAELIENPSAYIEVRPNG